MPRRCTARALVRLRYSQDLVRLQAQAPFWMGLTVIHGQPGIVVPIRTIQSAEAESAGTSVPEAARAASRS